MTSEPMDSETSQARYARLSENVDRLVHGVPFAEAIDTCLAASDRAYMRGNSEASKEFDDMDAMVRERELAANDIISEALRAPSNAWDFG